MFVLVILFFISQAFCQPTAVNDLYVIVPNTPTCLPLLANDITGDQIVTFASVQNSTQGYVYKDAPPFHLANATTVVFEAEDYQQLDFRSNTSQYDTNMNANYWQTVDFYPDSSAGKAMRCWPPNQFTYTTNTKYGPAMRYDIAFQSAGTYRVWVRGRTCYNCTSNGQPCDQGCDPAQTNDDSLHLLVANTSLYFASANGAHMAGVRNPWNWQAFGTAASVLVTASEIGWPPKRKSIYLAEREDGVVIDKIIMTLLPTNYGGGDQLAPALPYINCASNEVLYVPQQNFIGADSFTYTITNGAQVSSQATVSLFVGVAPTPSPSPSTSPSSTPSPSATPSVSSSPSSTPSTSSSPSVTPSVSPTASVTPSDTPTPSVTPSTSVTPTPSRTPSVTPTPSVSPSKTPSPSSSPSLGSSPSRTPTVTPSISVSSSVTPSISVSPSSTPSTSPSPSMTPSVSPSRTPSRSVTPSSSPSSSSTPSTSPTSSVTPSATASVTPSVSITPSTTPSGSPSPSVTPSATPTPIVFSKSDGEKSSIGLAVGLGVGLPLCAAGAGAVAFVVIRRRKKDDDNQESVALMALPVIPEPSDEKLAKFEQILLEDGYRLVKAMTKYTQITEADKIASWLTIDFEFNGLTVDLIKSLISREVKLASSLMRANSMASKMMKSLSGLIAKKYLKMLFQDIIEDIIKNPTEGGASFEVDPYKVPQNEKLEANQVKLQKMCSKFLRRIFDSSEKAPLEFRQICNALQKRVSLKFPESSSISVGGFLFLRVYCPAIVAPSGFGIVSSAPGSTAQRGLTLIAKTLQNVANNVTFGNKEEFMVWLNPFITSNLSACQDYFDEMATIPVDDNVGIVDEQRTISAEKREKALKDLYRHMKLLFPKMKEKYTGKVFFDSFYQIAKEDLEAAEAIKQAQGTQQGQTTANPTPAPPVTQQQDDIV